MIAEKISDAIRGRQLEPYEPDQGAARVSGRGAVPSSRRKHDRQVDEALRVAASFAGESRFAAQDAAAAADGAAQLDGRNATYSSPSAARQLFRPHSVGGAARSHLREHTNFVHNNYGQSILAGQIMKQML